MKNIRDLKFRGLHLYYQILKLHKGFDPTMEAFGNKYVRQEFELNKSANYEQYQQFLTQWFFYKQDIENQQNAGKKIGKNLDSDAKQFLNQDQQKTLSELKGVIKELKD